MGRAPCCQKVGLKKGRWTDEEDEILRRYIETHGEASWRSLPKNAGLLRCGKSCRLRWINYLKDGLKRGNITSEEEELIVKMHASLGNKWSLIAGHLPGRTDNEIKNYWNSHLSRKLHSFKGPDGKTRSIIVNRTNAGIPPKRQKGRISRSEMRKDKINYMPKDTLIQQPSYESNYKDMDQLAPSAHVNEKETPKYPVQDYNILDPLGEKNNIVDYEETVTNYTEKPVASREGGNQSLSCSNGESKGDLNSSCSSLTSFLEDTNNADWNWEDVVQGFDLDLSRDQETPFSWLWDDMAAVNEEFDDMEKVVSDWLFS